ncbi:SRPBCC domain-containing protein [Leptospira ilyithenensis]|uniref:Activator of Hsp90 ATPase homologue 1/2-like C-terminal domain-containing protein n=1 Tax=Leptospira ilyithenensis TaxID=2484901 RepID=A0A4R9LQ18_9LEPT|nr:SRPBCC domain-containing protein [Leptospira ilyithenensis]TGN09705.1 hypothetical protein EHS11_11495 [Leptospira ilyithenensis]
MKTGYDTKIEIPDRELVISRIFDAPRELIYRIWTDPKHVVKWWGPKDFTNPVCEMDLQVGGKYKFVMRSPEGIDYPVVGVYLEIVKNEKIVCTDVVEDHPQEWMDQLKKDIGESKDSPDSVVTVLFEDFETNKTKLTIQTRFKSNGVRDAFHNMGMADGWTESLDRFEAEILKV